MKPATILFALGLGVGCQQTGSMEEGEIPSIAVTRWTDKTELFIEYDALVAGRETLFAVHLTDLETFEPLSSAAPTLELTGEGGSALRFEAPAPARPGIYRVVATVPEPGRYRMVLRVTQPEDRHELGEVTVHGTVDDAVRLRPEETGEIEPTISFLKEQQWTTRFRTETVRERTLSENVRVPAEVQPRAGGEARVVSPVEGRVLADESLPTPGSRIRDGEVLARIAPRMPQSVDRASLELFAAESEAELEQARRERARAERLLAAKAIPTRELELARQRETVAAARTQAAEQRLRQFEETRRSGGSERPGNLVLLSSPLSGVLVRSHATPGATVEQGEELFQILDPRLVYVVGAIPEVEAARVRSPLGAALEVPGTSEPVELADGRGRLLSMGTVVDPVARTVPVIYELRNEDGALLVGQAVSLLLSTAETRASLAVPEDAIVQEGNQPVVFVQVGGESFVRRTVERGIRDRGFVEITNGLGIGERIVTEGAYEIRLSTLSGQVPAEGHVH